MAFPIAEAPRAGLNETRRADLNETRRADLNETRRADLNEVQRVSPCVVLPMMAGHRVADPNEVQTACHNEADPTTVVVLNAEARRAGLNEAQRAGLNEAQRAG